MDTKYKKFDRYSLVRLIAVILIIILTAVGSFVPVKWLITGDNEQVFERGVKQYFASDSEYDNSKFRNSFYDFSEDLRMVTGVYGDGSKDAYNRFLKWSKLNNTEKYISDYKEKYTADLLSKDICTRISAAYELTSGETASFRKLADHKSHCIKAERIAPDGDGMNIFYSDADNYDVYYDEDEGKNVTIYTGDGEHNEYYGDDEIRSALNDIYTPSRDNIPENVLKMAEKGEIVVNLCNTALYDYDYDGYYAVRFLDNEILSGLTRNNAMLGEETAEEYLKSYGKFKADADAALKRLNSSKLFNYAVFNGDALLCTNAKDLNGLSKEKVQEKFKKNDWYVLGCYTAGRDFSDSVMPTASTDPRMFTSNLIDTDCYDTQIYANISEALALKAEYDNEGKTAQEAMRTPLVVFIVCVVMILICFAVVIGLSGKIYGSDEIKLGAFGKIPLLIKLFLLTLIVSGAVGIPCSYFDGYYDYYPNASLVSSVISAVSVLLVLLLLELICYFVKNIRAHKMSHRFFTVLLFSYAHKKHKEKKEKLANEPAVYIEITKYLKKKFFLAVALVNAVVLFIALCTWNAVFFLMSLGALVVYDFVILLYSLHYAKYVMKIFSAIREIRGGNYTVRLNPAEMPKSLKRYAQDINTLGDSVKEAVEKAVKEQNTKTELITNVSHDLKTPLTSIINYVDLLSKCDISDSTAQSYIEVLGEKSARLKKLIEDLIEASKAQTGNITSTPVPVSLNELISQIVGEYDDEFNEKGLINILSLSQEQLIVSADSKLSHRVLDNLFNNASKYAMPGTRVYVNVFRDGAYGSVTVRNISADQLNISASELMSRFVRGDSSRSTSGNGLGLSIAENLCKAQNGRFGIEINGDMFTAKVDFLLYADNKPNEEYFYEQ